jgi:hypothetical protein
MLVVFLPVILVTTQTMGRENPVDIVLPKPESVATICYTSGTTGKEQALNCYIVCVHVYRRIFDCQCFFVPQGTLRE